MALYDLTVHRVLPTSNVKIRRQSYGQSTSICQSCHSSQKIVPVVIIAKELAPLDATCHDVL